MSKNGDKATLTSQDVEQRAVPSGIKLPIYMDNHATTPVDPLLLVTDHPLGIPTTAASATPGWLASTASISRG